MKCEHFCNAHCSFHCPEADADYIEESYGIPASDAGYEHMECKDCVYADKRCTCDDCYCIMCKVLHDNFGFSKEQIRDVIACSEAIGIFINDSGSGYECAVDWMRDEIGIDLEAE